MENIEQARILGEIAAMAVFKWYVPDHCPSGKRKFWLYDIALLLSEAYLSGQFPRLVARDKKISTAVKTA